MNAVTLIVPIESLLPQFKNLPSGGQIVSTKAHRGELRMVYQHDDIRTPFDFPQDYAEWTQAPKAKPSQPPPEPLAPEAEPAKARDHHKKHR